ncbi:MAG TPA: hypothetical protein VFA46_18180 [Actinomycetes bacterium]|jgi:hypothetical protein|nr:hypothetical protein [Actinomycetes bacterium]
MTGGALAARPRSGRCRTSGTRRIHPLVERPDVVGADLAEVADRMLAADR